MSYNLNHFLEYSLLSADTSIKDIDGLCKEAIKNEVAAICIPPLFVREARRILGEESSVRLATAIGFPMGYSSIAAKTEEIKRAVDEGADELDVVANLAAIKSNMWSHVHNDIQSCVRASHMKGRIVKLIIEGNLMDDLEIFELLRMAKELDVNYIKTGTGFGSSTASERMVQLLKQHLPATIKLCANGGVQNNGDVQRMLDAGAHRVGVKFAKVKTEK